jgi:quercetin dioxygenase-like cupin family protein
MPQNKLEKIWGFRERLLETTTVVVDRLTLDNNSFCSWHYHEFKYNMFIVLDGVIYLELENKDTIVIVKDGQYIVEPKIQHRFVTKNFPAIIMEVMYTKPVLEDDIIRLIQGGKIVNDKYIVENDLDARGFNGIKEEEYEG